MVRYASVATTLALALSVGVPGKASEQRDSMEALRADDECSAGDEACALNALQLRGALWVDAEGGPADPGMAPPANLAKTERPKKKKKKRKDITTEQAEEFEQQITEIMNEVDNMDKKLLYLDMDITSLNKTLWDVPQYAAGVNGTHVVWTDHDARWVPTFSLLETGALPSSDRPELPKADLPDDPEPEYIEVDGDEDGDDREGEDRERSLEAQVSEKKVKKKCKGKSKKCKKKKKINQHKKVKAELMYQLNRLAEFWSSFGAFQGRITQMNEWITTNVRRVHDAPVLAQVPPGAPPNDDGDDEPAPQPRERRRKKKCKGHGKKRKCKIIPFVEDDIVKGIGAAHNASLFIWTAVLKVDLDTETLKRRVGLYKSGETLAPTTPTTTPPPTTTTPTTTAADNPDNDDDYDIEYDDDDDEEPVHKSPPHAKKDDDEDDEDYDDDENEGGEDPMDDILRRLPSA